MFRRFTGGGPAARPEHGNAGGAIEGRVLDGETGEPIAQATVAVFTLPDSSFVTGAAADPDGRFSIAPLRPGRFQVRVSVVGFVTERLLAEVRPGPPVDLGDIQLAVSTEMLEEIGVEARRELIEQRADRTVYNVGDQPITSGDNVLETLKTLPSVEVDQDDNISLRGGQNVAIHINGRAVPVSGQFLAAYLRQISADHTERIEVIPNPSARYEPDGLSGIINIVLADDAPDRGLSGGLSLGGGTLPETNAGGNLAYQRGPFDVYGSYGFFFNESGFDGSTDRIYVPASGLVTLENIEVGDRTFNSHFGSLSVDYAPKSGTTLSLSGNLSARDGGGDNLQTTTSLFEGGMLTEAERLADTEEDGLNATSTLAFQRRFDEEGTHDLSAEVRFSSNSDTDDEVYASTDEDTESFLEESDRKESWIQLDYTRPLPGGIRLETGGKATWESINDDVRFGVGGGSGLETITLEDGFDYDRSIYAAYAQAAVPIGDKLEAQAGVRAEHADRAFVIDSEGVSNDFSYTTLFPSAFLLYNFSPGTSIKGSYSRRVNRPRTYFLSPFTSPEDRTVTRRGNPDLRPEFTNSFEVALQYKYALTVTPFFRHTTDVISRRFQFEDGLTVFTSENFATERSYGADLTLAAAVPGTPLRGFVSGSVFHSETDGGSIDPTINFGVTSWSARASVQAQLMDDLSVQFFGFFRGPRAIQGGESSGFGFTSLALQQKFLDDALSLSIRVNDPFATTRFEFTSTNEVYSELGVRDPDRRSIAATLTWTFGDRPERRRSTEEMREGGGMEEGGEIGL